MFSPPGTAAYFDSVGLPGALAYPVFALELARGAAPIAGIYARQVALLLTPTLAVAAWVHLPDGWAHTSAGGGWEYPVFLILASVVLWLLDDDRFSLRQRNSELPQRVETVS